MKTKTIRTLFKIGIIIAFVVFATMLWDYFVNESAWMEPLTIAAAVLLVILFIMLFLSPYDDKVRIETVTIEDADDGLDYVGDVHDVVDLEGIGPTYARKLKAIGITNTQELLFADPKGVAASTGAAAKTVTNWRTMCQLVKVRGVGPQYAEALMRAGIDGIPELRDEPAAAIAGAVQGYLDSLETNVIGQKITAKRVQGWQKAAKKLQRDAIDLTTLKVLPLESKQAKADAASA
mgnify:CR=1 FL=1